MATSRSDLINRFFFPSTKWVKPSSSTDWEKSSSPTGEDETMSRLLDNTSLVEEKVEKPRFSLVEGVTFQSMTEFLGLPQPPLTQEGMFEAFASEDPQEIKKFNQRLDGDDPLVQVHLN